MKARRRALAMLAGAALAPAVALRSARAAPDALRDEIAKLVGGRPLNVGRVKLDAPRLADNGHSVPLAISVESPMRADDHVQSITLLSERNPRTLIATFHLGPQAGRAQVATRVRLAGTQQLVAIAALSDGSFWSAAAEVVVTESACLDEP